VFAVWKERVEITERQASRSQGRMAQRKVRVSDGRLRVTFAENATLEVEESRRWRAGGGMEGMRCSKWSRQGGKYQRCQVDHLEDMEDCMIWTGSLGKGRRGPGHGSEGYVLLVVVVVPGIGTYSC
jgi:hypothetical protein